MGSNPTGGIDVCCECCVFLGRRLSDELITLPEESYRLCCVIVCDIETSWMRRPWSKAGCRGENKQTDSQFVSVKVFAAWVTYKLNVVKWIWTSFVSFCLGYTNCKLVYHVLWYGAPAAPCVSNNKSIWYTFLDHKCTIIKTPTFF